MAVSTRLCMVKLCMSYLGFRVQQRVGPQATQEILGVQNFCYKTSIFGKHKWPIAQKRSGCLVGKWSLQQAATDWDLTGSIDLPLPMAATLYEILTNSMVVEPGNTTSGWNEWICSNFANKKLLVQASTFSRTRSCRLCLVQAREASESILISSKG